MGGTRGDIPHQQDRPKQQLGFVAKPEVLRVFLVARAVHRHIIAGAGARPAVNVQLAERAYQLSNRKP